jgi:hypothetical protein
VISHLSDDVICEQPFGAVAELDSSVLLAVSQAVAYPDSPDSTRFDDILISSVFSTNFSPRCLLVSPFFWSIVVVGLSLLLFALMGVLKFYRKGKKLRSIVHRVFKHSDLIREGELWLGGVVSIAVIILIIFAYLFSQSFVNQYPIEWIASGSTSSLFACDDSKTNAKFTSSLMLYRASPPPSEQLQMFTLLENQTLILSVTFINTLFNCSSGFTVRQAFGLSFMSLPSPPSCTRNDNQSSLTLSVELPSHTLTMSFNVSTDFSLTAGAIRVGLLGPRQQGDNYVVQHLEFYEPLSYANRTLTQSPKVSIELLKEVNITHPLGTNGEVQYSGLI